MKSAAVVAALVTVAFCTGVHAQGIREGQDPTSLIAHAESARAAGDKILALREYTEAVNAMRLSGASPDKMNGCLVERDRLIIDLFSQLAEVYKRQAEILKVQKGISDTLAKIVLTDKDVQERTKKNEEKLKDIESILLDAVK